MSCCGLDVGGTYREAILPMTVQRGLDLPRVLEGSKEAVLDMKAARDAAGEISYDNCGTGHFYQPPPIAYTRPHRGRQPGVRRVTAGLFPRQPERTDPES